MLDRLFTHRGPVLGLLAAVALARSQPSEQSLAVGFGLCVASLLGRLWTITWIGPSARTRTPGPPDVRLTGGPYRLRHPLYLANTLIGVGFLTACRLPLTELTPAVGLLVAIYTALAVREERELRVSRVITGSRPRVSAAAAVRAERSTWLTFVAAALLLTLRAEI